MVGNDLVLGRFWSSDKLTGSQTLGRKAKRIG